MRAQALLWDRYRGFRDFHRVKIAPVTILIGKNGSGKSIVSRLPLILAAGLSSNAEGPIDLNAGDIEHADTYQDLTFRRGALPFTIGLTVGDESGSYTFATTMRYVHERRSLAVERFVLERNDIQILSLTLEINERIGDDRGSYKLEAAGQLGVIIDLGFTGLMPAAEALPSPLDQYLRTAHAAFQAALPLPSYLGPFREEPTRSGKMPSQSIKSLGARGQRALDLLSDDRLRRNGRLTQEVSNWFAKTLNQLVEIDTSIDLPRVVISNLGIDTPVSLADTGAGFAQVLPIVVQHFAYRMGLISTRLLIVEQPELHLHPAAHGALADLINETAISTLDDLRTTCIVETHSEQFITRLRRRVAEGQPPSSVRIISLSHSDDVSEPQSLDSIREICLDRVGDPDSWPAGVFEEALDDITAMRMAIRG